jgi:hypothetical protein
MSHSTTLAPVPSSRAARGQLRKAILAAPEINVRVILGEYPGGLGQRESLVRVSKRQLLRGRPSTLARWLSTGPISAELFAGALVLACP